MELQAKGLGNREGDAISRSMEESKSQHPSSRMDLRLPAQHWLQSDQSRTLCHTSQVEGVASTILYSCSNMQPHDLDDGSEFCAVHVSPGLQLHTWDSPYAPSTCLARETLRMLYTHCSPSGLPVEEEPVTRPKSFSACCSLLCLQSWLHFRPAVLLVGVKSYLKSC